MRAGVSMIVVAAALGGCNLVFGLDPPASGDIDAGDEDGDGGTDGDGGAIDAAGSPCAEPGVIFCATWSAGLYDDGFRAQSTILGGASIGVVDEPPRFARANLDDSSLIGEATIDAALAVPAPAQQYRIRVLMRGGLACASGTTNTVPIDMIALRFPASAIQVFVRRTGSTVTYGNDTPIGSGYTSVSADLGGVLHRFDLVADFTDTSPSIVLTVDDNPGLRVPIRMLPMASDTAVIVVGLRAAGSQPDCYVDYDDLSVSIGTD